MNYQEEIRKYQCRLCGGTVREWDGGRDYDGDPDCLHKWGKEEEMEWENLNDELLALCFDKGTGNWHVNSIGWIREKVYEPGNVSIESSSIFPLGPQNEVPEEFLDLFIA